MRIVSGTHKGRSIMAPKNLPVRPTTDIAKEALFNIFNNHFDLSEVNALDLFCGTGNISYEFASRGVKKIISVDGNYNCFVFVKKIILELDFPQIHPVKSDAFGFLKNSLEKFDIIFADPPFEMKGAERIPELVFEKQLLNENGWLIVEHASEKKFFGHAFLQEVRSYGKVNFSIFGMKNTETSE
ncbi:MAG: RsmD family RNA methyltransferase [Bacteroidia bacterium]